MWLLSCWAGEEEEVAVGGWDVHMIMFMPGCFLKRVLSGATDLLQLSHQMDSGHS